MIIEKYLKKLEKETKSMKQPIFRGQVDVYDLASGRLLPVKSTAARRLDITINNNGNKDVLNSTLPD